MNRKKITEGDIRDMKEFIRIKPSEFICCVVFCSIIIAIVLFTLLIILSPLPAKADDRFQDLKKEVQALQEARKADREQQNDPFYWSMREQIEGRHMTGYESRTSRALKRQMLVDSYPEYFDSDYNYRKAQKYLDLDHDEW